MVGLLARKLADLLRCIAASEEDEFERAVLTEIAEHLEKKPSVSLVNVAAEKIVLHSEKIVGGKNC